MALIPAQQAHLKPLGRHRLRVFSCLGGDVPHLPQYTAIAADADVFDAFRSFVERLVEQSSGTALDPLTKSLLAAGRLLIGDAAAADDILDALPQQPFKRDHGMGHCLVAPAEILVAVVPMPAGGVAAAQWCVGSVEAIAAKTWLETNRDRLVWREREGEYVLGTL